MAKAIPLLELDIMTEMIYLTLLLNIYMDLDILFMNMKKQLFSAEKVNHFNLFWRVSR